MFRPAAGLTAAVTGLALVLVPASASAAPDASEVVINEVYGGGGNSGSVYSHDFVELYNPTDRDIDLSGWAIDQRTAAAESTQYPAFQPWSMALTALERFVGTPAASALLIPQKFDADAIVVVE